MRHAAIALLLFLAQATPAFEVMTIKANDGLSRGGRSGWEPGGRFQATNLPGNMLVQIAYGTPQRTLLGYQLINIPAWLSNARYDIVGKVRTDLALTDPSELAAKGPQYLQSLLAERFKLRVHHETRQLQRYRLVRAKGDRTLGPRLRETSCMPDVGKAACNLQYGPNRYKFEGVTIARFAADLSGNLSQVIADDTGLAGRYDLELDWSLDQNAADDKPSVFTAMQEQLGLKLIAERGPVDVVVIDHVEHPSED
jgi:uncharacterized protein (TIGR03435 family)